MSEDLSTVGKMEGPQLIIVDATKVEKDGDKRIFGDIKNVSSTGLNFVTLKHIPATITSIVSGSSISPQIIEHTMDSAKMLDLTKLRTGSNTPETAISPREPIAVPNDISAEHVINMSKVVTRIGDGSARRTGDFNSPRSFHIAEQFKMIHSKISPTVSNASGTVPISGAAKNATTPYILTAREITRNTDVPSLDSTRMIRRGYSDDVAMMLKKGSNRLIKTHSHSSPRGKDSPAEYGHVYLNIYDLEAVNRVVNVVAGTFGAGAYHAGVEIYGYEYNFGYTPQGGSGIVQSHPRFHSSHKYRKSIDLGKTKFSPREVLQIIESLKPMWLGSSYDILKKNCLNFADALCKKLGVGSIPSWVMGLQNKINWTRDSLQSGAAKLKQFDEAVGISRAFGTLSRKLTGECAGGNN
ncbi:-PPPDE peptidase domain-containing protein 1 [Babesia bigemina]|uniref:-PPPDE peptidase domain-containing protein 1 n=1 Tax=Babesia bigemina TaxID=5866 RepID=A0A061DAC0_BABBI|nr:-PPPDE peptidase domain-containing protein 1 [Babesia bigemina]CDR97656.1 -PPPDE peptidase domain-containing protein 1 [Babesia bigemina]|eukprot:XP_012769842.1 -PPPDE peptidase domain-containing protein 1 [Babesia bigemina]